MNCPSCGRKMQTVNPLFVQCNHCQFMTTVDHILEWEKSGRAWSPDKTTPEQEEDLHRAEKKYGA